MEEKKGRKRGVLDKTKMESIPTIRIVFHSIFNISNNVTHSLWLV